MYSYTVDKMIIKVYHGSNALPHLTVLRARFNGGNLRGVACPPSGGGHDELSRELDAVSLQRRGASHTAAALRRAVDDVFTLAAGDRTNADDVILLLTNGGAAEQTGARETAAEVKAADIRIISVGMSTSVSVNDLLEMSSEPHRPEEDFFTAIDFDRVAQQLDRLVTAACLTPATAAAKGDGEAGGREGRVWRGRSN